MLLLFDTKPKR